MQIGTGEDLVTRPATDYVRSFVAKVPPARVIRGATIIKVQVATVTDLTVSSEATIAEIAPKIVAGSSEITVIDATGKPLGLFDRQKALEIMAMKI